MNTTTCAVHQAVQRTEELDAMPLLAPAPTNIKDQMPLLAGLLQGLATNMDRDSVQALVKASAELRHAYDLDDFGAASAVYASRVGWIDAQEGGVQLGIPEAHMRAFARRHRRRGRGG